MAETDTEELDFEIINEPWNKYKLEDGSLLRLRNSAVKTYKSLKGVDQFGFPVYGFAGAPLLSVTVPKGLMGIPSSDENITPADITNELKFTTVREDWYEYKLTDGTILRTKTVVTKIFRTRKFNKLGEPIYWCSWQVLTDRLKP